MIKNLEVTTNMMARHKEQILSWRMMIKDKKQSTKCSISSTEVKKRKFGEKQAEKLHKQKGDDLKKICVKGPDIRKFFTSKNTNQGNQKTILG